MTWVDKGQDRGSKAQRGTVSAINAHTHTQNTLTHAHTNTLRRQGQRQSRVGATRRGLVRYLRLQQLLLLLLPHRIPKREPSPAKKKKRRQSRRKKLASFIIILYLFFFCSFSNTQAVEKSVFLYSVCARRGRQSSAALETCFIALSLSLPPSLSLFLFLC